MRIILFIFLLEILALTLWLTRRWLFANVRVNRQGALLRAPIVVAVDNRVADGRVSASLDQHWAFINEWHLEDQRDDRTPMIGSVADGPKPLSARRALARRSHQVNYKEWSKGRHD